MYSNSPICWEFLHADSKWKRTVTYAQSYAQPHKKYVLAGIIFRE